MTGSILPCRVQGHVKHPTSGTTSQKTCRSPVESREGRKRPNTSLAMVVASTLILQPRNRPNKAGSCPARGLRFGDLSPNLPIAMVAITTTPRKSTLPTDQPEFAVYAALKFYIYGNLDLPRFAAQFQKTPAQERWFFSLSSRKVHRMLCLPSTTLETPTTWYSDFVDVSPYFIRERLNNLNHGTYLARQGRGLRGAVVYQWSEAPDEDTLRSFRRLREHLGSRLNLALDLHRLMEEFGGRQFSTAEFLRLFQAYRNQCLARRWYGLRTDTTPRSTRFSRLLLTRLNELVTLGLIQSDGPRVRLTEKGHEIAHWFELFVYSAHYDD